MPLVHTCIKARAVNQFIEDFLNDDSFGGVDIFILDTTTAFTLNIGFNNTLK